MRKVLTILFVVGIGLAARDALAGCGSNTGRNAPTTANPTTRPTTGTTTQPTTTTTGNGTPTDSAGTNR